jgi:hypothetical protein
MTGFGKTSAGSLSGRKRRALNMTGCLDYEIGCNAFDERINNEMSNATKRAILRWISSHLCHSDNWLELPSYVPVVRFVSIPVLILSEFWMYAGVVFAIIGVALWLTAIYLSGYGAAIMSLVALFIARKTWLVIRARQSKRSDLSTRRVGGR